MSSLSGTAPCLFFCYHQGLLTGTTKGEAMNRDKAIKLLGEIVRGAFTTGPDFREAAGMGCAALSEQQRREADDAKSEDPAANDRHR